VIQPQIDQIAAIISNLEELAEKSDFLCISYMTQELERMKKEFTLAATKPDIIKHYDEKYLYPINELLGSLDTLVDLASQTQLTEFRSQLESLLERKNACIRRVEKMKSLVKVY